MYYFLADHQPHELIVRRVSPATEATQSAHQQKEQEKEGSSPGHGKHISAVRSMIYQSVKLIYFTNVFFHTKLLQTCNLSINISSYILYAARCPM